MRTAVRAQGAMTHLASRPRDPVGTYAAYEDLSPMALLLRDLGDARYDVLSHEQERALARRVRAGDLAARRELIERNLRLVISIARRYMAPGMDLADLVGEGIPGLTRAVDKFDPDAGTTFATYATWWIRQSIGRAVDQRCRPIAVPVHAAETLRLARTLTESLTQATGRAPTREELVAAITRVPRTSSGGSRTAEVVWAALTANDAVSSLDAPVSDQHEADPMGAFLADPSDPYEAVLDETAGQDELARLLRRAQLTERERQVLAYRYRHGLTLEQTGKLMGCSRQRVEQIHKRALRQLRQAALVVGMDVSEEA